MDVLEISGEEIPADDNRFDTIVCTWTLCSIPNVYRALEEMYRVVKPGGRFYFVEHGLSPDAGGPALAATHRALLEDYRRRLPPYPHRQTSSSRTPAFSCRSSIQDTSQALAGPPL